MVGRIVGFDIGESEVKMAYCVGGKLKKAVRVPLPENMVENGEILSMDAMADFLRTVAKENGIPRGAAAVRLPSSLIFTRNVEIPLMSEEQLKYNIAYEFRDYLTMEKEKYIYDYSVYHVEEDGDEGQGRIGLFACAAPRSLISDYRAMFARAGFKLKVAVPEEWAYLSLLNAAGKENELACIADLGHTSTRLLIFNDGKPDTRKVIDMGLADLDRIVAESNDVDIHVAHSYTQTNYNGVQDSEAAVALYEQMAVEIMKTVNFYNYNNRDVSLEGMYLCGGGAAVKELERTIESVAGLNIYPLKELLHQPGVEDAQMYLLAYGCALCE